MNNKIWAIDSNFILSYLDQRAAVQTGEQGELNADESPDILTLGSDGVAVIRIFGVLTPDGPDFIDKMLGFGGTGYRDIIQAADLLAKRPDVTDVRLKVNTPGGDVELMDETYQAIFKLAQVKNVISENHGRIASAGYYIVSPASKITAISPIAQTGAIGIVITGYERYNDGYSGKRHMLVSRGAPEKAGFQTEVGRDSLQELADSIERVFFRRVSEARGVSVEKIKTDFGRGGMLVARDPDPEKPDALSVGMIDEVTTFQTVAGVKPPDDNTPSEGAIMDITKLMTDNPGLEAHLKELKKTVDSEGYARGVTDGGAAVQARIEKASVFIGSETYPKPIQDLAVKVAKGESDISGLESAVAVYDAIKAEDGSNAAAGETGETGETPGEQPPKLSTDGTIMNAADFDAEVAAERAAMGIN